jgi:hypothetical protein
VEQDMLKLFALLVAAVMAYGGILLARFAEADDAPGGVLIGMVIIMGAVALAIAPFLRRKT